MLADNIFGRSRYWIDQKGDLLVYAKNALSFVADDFEEMEKWDWLTNEEQIAISVYEMN